MKLEFGATAPTLFQQLDDMELKDMELIYDSEKIAVLQKDADAITRLVVRGLISSGTAHTARKRLMKKLTLTTTLIRRL